MIKVFDIIKQLENTSGSNDKINILKENKDNELFKKVLVYSIDKDKKYGISLTMFKKITSCKFIGECKYKDMFMLLDILASNNINDSLRREINLFYYSLESEEEKELFKRVILKKLNIGVTEKSINKAIPNLLVEFQPMKASAYDKHSKGFNKRAKQVGYMIFLKKNGFRAEVFKQDGKVIIKSRQNKIIEGLIDLEEEFKDFPDGFLYEGELLAEGDFKTSDDQFKATDMIVSKKGIKTGIYIDLFDCCTIEGFNNKKYDVVSQERKEYVSYLVDIMNKPHIHYAYPVYEGNDITMIDKMMKEHTAEMKEEGLMVLLKDTPYECKLVNYHLKVKEFFNFDLKVIGINEGKEETTKGKMGSLEVDFRGNSVSVHGFTEELKKHYWEHPEDIIGKIIEVSYKAITKDKTGKESLQFPTFIKVRNDKNEVSYE